MSGKVVAFLMIAAAALVAVTVVLVMDGERPPAARPAAEKPKRVKAIPAAERAKLRAQAAAKTPEEMEKPAVAVGMYTHMDEEDRKVALAIQDALDNEDLDKLKDLLAKARASKNAEIRRLMVEALQWFDAKAMQQLAPFLGDEDEEVRKAAVSAWDLVLNNLEDEGIKAALLVESLQMVRDEDDADTICSQFNTLDQKLAIDSMVKLLYGTLTVSKPARKKILETYEFITGEEYTNAQAARAWLRENYTPPEKD